MVGVGLDMVTYFRGVNGLMLLQAFDEVSAGLANIPDPQQQLKRYVLLRWRWGSLV